MKKMSFILLLLTITASCFSQKINKPFFGKVKDVGYANINSRGVVGTKVTPMDSTFMNLRPVTGVAYSFPNNQAQGYAGISYGNTTYNYESKESYINWSIDLVYSLGKTTVKEIESEGSSFGIGGFVLNRTVGVLFLMNKYKKVDDPNPAKYKPTVAVSWGINL